MRNHLQIPALLALIFCMPLCAAERKEVRVLYDFEEPAELKTFMELENTVLDLVIDNGVTHGKNCARTIFKAGSPYCSIHLGPQAIKSWSNFDYFAMDVFMEREEKIQLMFELFDGLSKNYATRCTMEQTVRPGKQTLVFPINRAKRNGKEGRDWDELQPNDKIKMDALTRVKIFLVPPAKGDLVWWIDNLRILQEDALGGKMKVELPAGAKAFDFGAPGTLVGGFTPVPAQTKFDPAKGFGLSAGGDLQNCGKHWPDPLTGDGVFSPSGEAFAFDLALPDGEYNVWLSAGPIIRDDLKNPHYLLTLGDQVLMDEKPSLAELFGEKWLYRFMRTQYSERENALYLDFIDRMYPVIEKKVKVSGGKLQVRAQSHWLAALIAVPAADEAAFKKLSADIRAERLRSFWAVTPIDPQKKPQPKAGDGAFVAFVPDELTYFHPATAPNDTERARKQFDLAGAPAQRLVFKLGLTAFEDVGKCSVAISPLKGPGEIPASATRIYFQDYRVAGSEVRESALIPSSELNAEKGIAWCWWMWMKIPDDAKAGTYTGTVTLTTPKGEKTFPVEMKVYPFKLEEILPYSFGMYYSPPQLSDAAERKRVTAEQFAFMREIGFTGAYVGGGGVKSIRDNNTVDAVFDFSLLELAKAAGMGRHPAQLMMANSLGGARAIARHLRVQVDQDPGSEFKHPRLKPLFLDYAKQYAAFLEKQNFPIAVEIVDEPREVPNPWNRNLEHTNLYGDWLHEAGVKNTFVTPMGDSQSGKDYTSLIDHTDILSTHAGKGSERLMKMTPEKKKTLWLYNTGMDRLSWGFYNWRVGSTGRWEWHFCYFDEGADIGYMNQDWYNPFTGRGGLAPRAPLAMPGAILFQSPYLSCSEGITDSAYIVTLEKAIRESESDAKKADAVAKAKAFLAEVKAGIPFLPGVKGISNEAEGALVGKGLEAPASAMCETWRRKIAELLIALK